MDLVKRVLGFFASGSKPVDSVGREVQSGTRQGDSLPSFRNAEEAELALFLARDEDLEMLRRLASTQNEFVMDYSPESLQNLEAWYFDLHGSDGFDKLNVARTDFERLIAMYFGAVGVKNVQEVKWIVRPFAFTPDKFEIGVRRRSLPFMLTGAFRDLFAAVDNDLHNSLLEEYHKHFS